ncbi:hypothetical protein ACJX0J_020203, partial [Zea mays]
ERTVIIIMRYPVVLTAAFSAAAIGFLIGISFPVQITPKVYPSSFVADDADSSTLGLGDSNVLGRFSTARNSCSRATSTVGASPPPSPILQQPNATAAEVVVVGPGKPKGAARLPPGIVVEDSDLHLRRLWGNPHEDTPPRKYLLVLTVGYSEKDSVNAIVQKFSENFDIMLFHYDGQTTEWDAEFEWSRQAVHVSARKQAKWWYAKRFMHPSVLAPYEYVFLWDQDLGVEAFEAEAYLRIVRRHALEISQPGLDIVRGVKTYDVNVRREEGGEIHTSDGFVEVMAPVFTREAWTCVWHMIQNDLVHGWGLDWNFWRCVN